jgi:hypothetical protein
VNGELMVSACCLPTSSASTLAKMAVDRLQENPLTAAVLVRPIGRLEHPWPAGIPRGGSRRGHGTPVSAPTSAFLASGGRAS